MLPVASLLNPQRCLEMQCGSFRYNCPGLNERHVLHVNLSVFEAMNLHIS